MNHKQEFNFAYKIRHALDQNLSHLPATTTDRLIQARQHAVSLKSDNQSLSPVLVLQNKLAGRISNFVNTPLQWLGRMGLVIPLIAVAAGLVTIYQIEQQQHISDTADIDAAVLSDELPLSAYLDYGFSAYLARRVE